MGSSDAPWEERAERERWRARLLAERRRLQAELDSLRGGLADAETGGIGELSLYDQHPADLGSELAARQVDMGLMHNARHLLQQVERALERLADGTYGVCEGCGQPIPRERLDALPAATRCAACQAESERAGEGARGMDRPPEETVLTPPFGPSPDAPGGVDREEAWRLVARHGTANSPQDAPEEWTEELDGGAPQPPG